MASHQVRVNHPNQGKMAEMVRLITQRGPSVDEVSRAIGVPSETVRHWYKQLLRTGFAIQASCDYESLGMKRVIALVELRDDFKWMAEMMFYLMSESAFLLGYSKTGQGGSYILNFSVPEECIVSWTDAILQLKKKRVFGSIEAVKLDWVRNVPMRAEYFDFETGRWTFNGETKGLAAAYSYGRPNQKQKYDVTDLKIIGQLQVDANMSLKDMCEKVGTTNYKTFTWHFREHVLGRHLIKGYRVNWTGRVHPSSSGRRAREKRYSWVDVVARDLSEDRRLELAMSLNTLPFVWIEGAGTREYYARMVFPLEQAPLVLDRLQKTATSSGNRVKWYRMDPSRSTYFSMETGNYDEDNHRWNFVTDKLLDTFESLSRIRQRPAVEARDSIRGKR